MLPERITEIKTRLGKASPGPWEVESHRHFASGCRCLSCDEDPTGFLLDNDYTHWCEDKVDGDGKNGFGNKLGSCDQHPLLKYEDADFAAHAREDVPFLLGLLEELLAENSELERLLGDRDELFEENRALKNVNGRFRRMLGRRAR